MRVPYGEGLASHTGPESCGRVRKAAVEALTGVRAGWAIEPRKRFHPERRRLATFGRQYRPGRHRKTRPGSAGSKTPRTHRRHLARKPGDPVAGLGSPQVRAVNREGTTATYGRGK